MILYSVEIASNTTLALNTLYQNALFFSWGILVPFIVDATPHVSVLFFIFGAIMMAYLIFAGVFIKETRGLSDRDKKQIYAAKKN